MLRFQFKNPWANRLQTMLHWRQRSARETLLSPPAAAVPPSAEWDEAFLRVESYLRAHQIESRVLLVQLTTEILAAARPLAAEHPEMPPVTIAMHVAHARIGDWLERALGDGHWADDRFRARGRLALLMARVPQNLPEHFLSSTPLSDDVRARLADSKLQPGPELRLTSMPPAPLEFPLAEAAEEKWTTFSRSALLRSSASWIVIIGFLGAVWFATR